MPGSLFRPIANLKSQQPKFPNLRASWLQRSRASELLESAKPRFPLKALRQLPSLDTARSQLAAPAGKWGRHRSSAVGNYSLDFRFEILETDRAKTQLLGDQITIRKAQPIQESRAARVPEPEPEEEVPEPGPLLSRADSKVPAPLRADSKVPAPLRADNKVPAPLRADSKVPAREPGPLVSQADSKAPEQARTPPVAEEARTPPVAEPVRTPPVAEQARTPLQELARTREQAPAAVQSWL